MLRTTKRFFLCFCPLGSIHRQAVIYKTGNLSLIKLTFILKRLFTDKRIPFFVCLFFFAPISFKNKYLFTDQTALGYCCEKSISLNFLTASSLTPLNPHSSNHNIFCTLNILFNTFMKLKMFIVMKTSV